MIIVDLYVGNKRVREGIKFKDIVGPDGETISALSQAQEFAADHKVRGRTAKARQV